MQPAHEFGRLDVDRVLILEGTLLHAQDEAELFDMLGQVGQGKSHHLPLVQIVQARRSESR